MKRAAVEAAAVAARREGRVRRKSISGAVTICAAFQVGPCLRWGRWRIRYQPLDGACISLGSLVKLPFALQAAPGAPPAKGPVGPASRFGPRALEANVMALRPHAGLQHHREPYGEDEYTAWARQGAYRNRRDHEQYAEREYRPFDRGMVEKGAPLILADHCDDVGQHGSCRKDLRCGSTAG